MPLWHPLATDRFDLSYCITQQVHVWHVGNVHKELARLVKYIACPLNKVGCELISILQNTECRLAVTQTGNGMSIRVLSPPAASRALKSSHQAPLGFRVLGFKLTSDFKAICCLLSC